MGFGTGQTLPDLGGQRFHEIEGGGIVERLLSEARCGDDQRFRTQRVGGCYRYSGACREGDRHDENAQDLAHLNCSLANLLRYKSLRVVFNGTKCEVKI